MGLSGAVPAVSPVRPAVRRTGFGYLFLPLMALAVLGAAIAVLLVFSPLWGLPDTYCQTVLSRPVGGGCSRIVAHRWMLIAVALALALVLCAAGLGARAGSNRSGFSRIRLVVLGLLALTVILGLSAASFVAIGTDNGFCGSLLSRVDEHGSYSPDHPRLCAPTYDAGWTGAWITAGLGVATLTSASWLEAIGARRHEAEEYAKHV